MRQDLRNDLRLLNAGNHLELSAAAGAGVDLDAEDALEPLRTAYGHRARGGGNVQDFSPNGKWIVTASDDNTARVYPWEMFAPTEDILDLSRKRILQELTLKEREKYLHEPQSKAGESEPKQ